MLLFLLTFAFAYFLGFVTGFVMPLVETVFGLPRWFGGGVLFLASLVSLLRHW